MVDWLVPLGAGVYWASITLSHVPGGATNGSGFGINLFAGAITVGAVVLACILRGRHMRVLRVLTLALCLCSFGVGCVRVMGGGGVVIQGYLDSLTTLALMFMWGTVYVATDRVQAFDLVLRTALVSLATHGFLMVAFSLVGWSAFPVTIRLLCVVSACLLLRVGPAQRPLEVRSLRPVGQGGLAEFAISRVLVGFVLGVSIALAGIPRDASAGYEFSVWSAVASCVVVLGVAFLCELQRRRGDPKALLPLIPLIVLVWPACFAGDVTTGLSLSYSVIWFSWIVMSSVQLSELKWHFGIDDMALVFGEKALVVLPSVAGLYCAQCMLGSTEILDLWGLSALMSAVCLIFCGYSALVLNSLATDRIHEAVMIRVAEDDAERMRLVFHSVACRYGLSEREEEVLAYLAKGHTRTYISDMLGIAAGTVRSHADHIYKKTGCHTKEELLALVEDCMEFER